MARIQQLSPSVVTKIAAGEVIERPASVVKELLENSVDAGSTRIDVEVEQGGLELIRVADNGCGIPAEDFSLAFASHATSKLSSADDLFRITTLGFRGEALASIGGVAQVKLQSRTPDSPAGAEASCRGGELGPVVPWNGSPGTRIEVRHLFYNTPVRRKFLRTPATELGHVTETFTRLVLAHPGIHWTLRHNGKGVHEVPAHLSLPERVAKFFGEEVRDQLYEIDSKAGPARLWGQVADPACDRGHARLQYLFVNGRWIRDRTVMAALQEAYRGLLMTGRYAVAFLFLELPPDMVDVNVHPTKAEVRFREGNAVYHLVLGAVRERLRAEELVPKMQAPSVPTMQPAAGEPREGTLWARPPEGGTRFPEPPAVFTPRPGPADGTVRGQEATEATGTTGTLTAKPESVPHDQDPGPHEQDRGPREQEGASPPVTAETLAAAETFRALQVHDTYLVLETDEGMLVIDQHALHERILFDHLRRRLQSGTLQTQKLLIPEPVDLTAEQAARVLEHRQALAELGLGVEEFGGQTVLVTSYPAMLERQTPREILLAVVDHLVAQDRPPSREALLNDLLALMACHSAVRAGERLTPEQMDALLAQRHLAIDPHHCPHGRPTALLFTRQELERQFRRIP